MTLLQVFNRYLNPGGEETSVARIAHDLETGGHRVIRFWRSTAEWSAPSAPPRWKHPLLLWRNPDALDELRRQHHEARPDCWILHNVIPVVSLGIYALASELRVPIVQWLHNYRPISPSGTLSAGPKLLRPDDRFLAWKEAAAGSWNGRVATAWLALCYFRLQRTNGFRSVSAWVAVSEEMRGIFEKAGFPRDRLHVLRHSWNRGPSSLPARDEGYFLFLGRLVESKGLRFLIDLWRDPAFSEIPLVVAGEGPLREELEPLAPHSVRWAGFVQGEEKRRFIGGCRAILFPSVWPEPLSTVAYEAYEQSKPIVVSDRGGMREIVEDGRTGWVLGVDREIWRPRLLEIARDPATAFERGRRGRQWLEENVSAAQWNAEFDRIAAAAMRAAPDRPPARRAG